jgi:VWFA-related protein
LGHQAISALSRISTLFIVGILSSSAFSQPKERPRLKDFGSSLKRIKWDPAKRAAVETKPKPIANTDSDNVDVVKIETSLVVTDLLVLDSRGNPVTGLTEKDFVIREDEQPQEIGLLSLGDNRNSPRSIVLIIDYSGSQYPFLQTSIAAAKVLVDKLGPLDQMAIVTDDVELLQNFTSNKKTLKENLGFLLARTNPASVLPRLRFGKSHQYSALMAVLKEAVHSEDERLIVIFQTDGDQFVFLRDPILVPTRMYHENGGEAFQTDPKLIEKRIAAHRTEFSLNDVIRAAEKSRATIYSIVPGFEILGRSPEDQVKQLNAFMIQSFIGVSANFRTKARGQFEKESEPETLRYIIEGLSKQQFALTAVSTASGGWTAYLERPDQADGIYSSIFLDINRRYLVGYYSTNKAHDGKRRAISFQIREHPEYKIIGRRSYYAAGIDQ